MAIRTVFKNGTVFDGTAAGIADLVIEGRHVVDVGTDLDGDHVVTALESRSSPGCSTATCT